MTARATLRRLRFAALAAGIAVSLAGCESFDLVNLIPDSKKKLPGERREVFPGGVPGVPQGVPAELVKGYQAPPDGAAVTAPAEAAPEPEKKQAAKPKPKRAPKPTPTVAPEYQQQSTQQPQSGQGQWPSQQRQPQQSAWPAPPKSGTFSR